MNSKSFHLFSFNTYEHNVYIKEFRFFHFQFNPFKNLTHWKQKSYFPKLTSFRWRPFRFRHSVSLLRTPPITVWSISTGICATSCWIRCFNSWTVWGAGALKTWLEIWDSPSDTEWRRAERCGFLSMSTLTTAIFSGVRTVFTLPPFFCSAKPVAPKSRTQVLMAWADGTAGSRWFRSLFEIHAERSQNCHRFFVKRFHSKSTLCSSPRLHCN